MAHVRVQQFYRGVPVLGGEAIAHLNSDGSLSSVTDNLVPAVTVIVAPSLTSADAIARAREGLGSADWSSDSAGELWIVRRDGRDHLAYRVAFQFVRPKPMFPVVFVDSTVAVWCGSRCSWKLMVRRRTVNAG